MQASLRRLQVEALNLMQLHCPDSGLLHPQGVRVLDEIVPSGKLCRYGVSVEEVEEGAEGGRVSGRRFGADIYNIFRQRPARLFFREAKRKGVATISRVPLSSGMLTGKMTKATEFANDDHREFNRDGASFDKGETFSGVPYDVGLAAVEELRPLVPAGTTMAAFALRWILMNDGVTTVIPGARNAAQAAANSAADDVCAGVG